MNDKTQTSLPIAMAQTRGNLIKVINESNLPLCILAEMVQNIFDEIQQKAAIELQNELEKTKEDKIPEEAE